MKKPTIAYPRKLLAATALVTAMSIAASSAYGWGGHPAAEHRLDYIFNQLDLTETQREQSLAIFAERAQQQRDAMKEHRQSMRSSGERPTRPTTKERDARMAEMRMELADQLGLILQAHQVEGLMEYLEAHTGRTMRKGVHDHSTGRGRQ